MTYLFSEPLAVLQSDKNELAKAEESYLEALKIRRQLASVNPEAYLPDLARTATGLSLFFLQNKSNKQKSISYLKEAIKSLVPFIEKLHAAQQLFQLCIQIIKTWKIDPKDFLAELGKE